MSDKNSEELAEDRTAAAEKRTDLAEDRTIQATERTFAGWMRTAFAAIGVGIAFHALFGDFDPPWLAKVIATLFILMAAVMAFTAGNRASASFKHLNSHEVDTPTKPNLLWISWSVVAGALVLIAALWLLHNGGP